MIGIALGNWKRKLLKHLFFFEASVSNELSVNTIYTISSTHRTICWVTNELSASIYSVKIGHIWRVPVLLKWFLLRSTNKLLVLETLRSRFGHFTANVKLRFAVNGFTLPVCPYFGLTAVTINTRLRRVFSCLFKPKFSWTSINCFHGFPRALTERVPSSVNEGRIISNDDGFLKLFY